MYLKNETTAVEVLCSSPYGRNTFHKWHLGGLLIYIVWNEVFTLKTHLTQEQNMLGVAFKRHHMSHQSLTSTVHLYHYDHEHAHELGTSNKRRSAVQRTSSWGESKTVPHEHVKLQVRRWRQSLLSGDLSRAQLPGVLGGAKVGRHLQSARSTFGIRINQNKKNCNESGRFHLASSQLHSTSPQICARK